MAYKKEAGGWEEFDYPVELVWRALTNSSTATLIDPMDEAAYEKGPAPGAVFTRALEREVNEKLGFEIKTSMYTARWLVELDPKEACKTRVSVKETVDFTDFKSFLRCRFGIGLGREVSVFLSEIESRLKNYERKLKRK